MWLCWTCPKHVQSHSLSPNKMLEGGDSAETITSQIPDNDGTATYATGIKFSFESVLVVQ